MWQLIALGVLGLGAPLAFAADPPATPADLRMPPCTARVSSYYPFEAMRRDLQGRVLVEFQIDAAGHARNVTKAKSDADRVLVEGALSLVRSYKCVVPRDWAKLGGPTRHFRYSISYALNDTPPAEPYQPSDGSAVVHTEVRP